MNIVIKDIEATGEVNYSDLAEELDYEKLAESLDTAEFGKRIAEQFDASSFLIDHDGDYSSHIRSFYDRLSQELDYKRLVELLKEDNLFLHSLADSVVDILEQRAAERAKSSQQSAEIAKRLGGKNQ